MQGTVINHNGEAVKAAEISVRKIISVSELEKSDTQDGSAGPLKKTTLGEMIRVETGEDGTFILENLDPDAKYVFEIKRKESIANQTYNIQNPHITAPIRSVDTVTRTGEDGWNDQKEDDWNDQEEDEWNDQEEDEWNDREEDGWDDQEEDGWDDQDKDGWNLQEEDGGDDGKGEPFKEEHPIKSEAADNDDDYDDSEWFDLQEQEVMEQYAGNMIKPKKDLEDKLITIRKYIW